MRDIELYRHLLGIASLWTVAQVELSVPKQRVGGSVSVAGIKGA